MENEKKIELDVLLTFNDFWRVLLWYQFRRSILRVLMIAFLIAIALLMIFTGIIKQSFLTYFPAICFSLFVPLLLFYGVYASARNGSRAVKGSSRYVFSSEGLEGFSATASSQALWSNYSKIIETKTDFILFSQVKMIYPIPKRFFESEAQINDFRKIVRSAFGDNAKLRK